MRAYIQRERECVRAREEEKERERKRERERVCVREEAGDPFTIAQLC